MGCCEKLEEYSKLHKDAARYAKALSHPARIAMLDLLATKCCICNDLVESLPLAQSTVSQHLKILKEAGLVEGIIKRPSIEYHLNVERWKETKKIFTTIFSE